MRGSNRCDLSHLALAVTNRPFFLPSVISDLAIPQRQRHPLIGPSKIASPAEDGVQHVRRHAAGERVLLTGVVAAEDD
jgi:hypothetical protein